MPIRFLDQGTQQANNGRSGIKFEDDSALTQSIGEDSTTQEQPFDLAPPSTAARKYPILQSIENLPVLNPIGAFRKAREAFTSGREASKGAFPGLLDIAQEVAPSIPTVGPALGEGLRRTRPVIEQVGSGLGVDEALGINAGIANAVVSPITEAAAPLDREVRSRVLRAALNVQADGRIPESSQTLIDRRLDSFRRGDSEFPLGATNLGGTESVTANLPVLFAEGAIEAPVTTAAFLGGPTAIKGLSGLPVRSGIPKSTPPRTAVGRPPNAPVDLLQQQFKPGKSTQFGQNFEELANRGLRRIVEEEKQVPTKGEGHNRFIQNAEQSRKTMGRNFEEMHTAAEEAGKTFDPKAFDKEISIVQRNPWFRFIEPEVRTKMGNLLKQNDISLRDAHKLLTEILERKRRIDQMVGAGEDVANSANRIRALNALETAIKKQLNEKLSRFPNEYVELTTDFHAVASLEELARASQVASRNIDSPTIGKAMVNVLHGAGTGAFAGALIGAPLGGTVGGALAAAIATFLRRGARGKNVGKAIDVATKRGLPEPARFGPQKPSTLPEQGGVQKPSNIPVTDEALARDFPSLFEEFPKQFEPTLEPFEPPALKPKTPAPEPFRLPPPDWIDNIVEKPAYNKIKMANDIKMIRSIVEGKSKKTMAEVLANPDVSAWAKNVVKRLAEAPDMASEFAGAIDLKIQQKINPISQKVPKSGKTFTQNEFMKKQTSLVGRIGLGLDPEFPKFIDAMKFDGEKFRTITEGVLTNRISEKQAVKLMKEAFEEFKLARKTNPQSIRFRSEASIRDQ